MTDDSDTRELSQEDMERLAEQQAMQQSVRSTNQDTGNDSGQWIDVEQVKAQIRQSLRGSYWKLIETPDGDIVRRRVDTGDEGRKLCNEKCVQEINRTIEGNVNDNIQGSFFSGKDVYFTGAKAMYAVNEKLYVNQEEFDIDGRADAAQISSIVASNLKGAIKKAKGGRLLKHEEQTREIREVRKAEEDDESRPSLRDSLPM